MPHATLPASRAALILLVAAAAACGTPSADAHPPRPVDPASSASAASPAAGTSASTASGCPVPVCRYAGSAWAEDLIGDELVDRGEARVVWTFSHMDGREAVYLASGDVTAAWRTDRCAIALNPAAHAIASGAHTRLKVDFTTRPVRYSGTGSSEWAGTQTWSCIRDEPFTQEGVSTKWFAAEEMTSADPGLLQGTQGFETGRSGWEFRNAP
ncbi:MAG TPA: hypothetical protein VHG93_22000 [Longimicrobium sp.]|nr:hypothetical protein [Longimicrobium sp.]